MTQELLDVLIAKEVLRRETIRVHRNLLWACIFLFACVVFSGVVNLLV
ncbi:hypothetical protein LCGC14_1301220 [marine sediment metagenome]|uniref:Uncharacterized protein n=1 Tax=marine sediment metagenome TaxID=412755 RepID=A0A0F9LA63_9ZZZZ